MVATAQQLFRNTFVPPQVAVRERARQVAVVLNCNAAKVNSSLIEDMERRVGSSELFVTRSLDQARTAAEAIIDRRYGTVLLGGGDGTLTQGITDLAEQARRRGVSMPRLGVLPLGTGNSMAFALDALDRNAVLERAKDGVTRPVELLSVEGRLAPFAGAGLDAQILDDYANTGETLSRVGLSAIPGGPTRYAIACATRSLPRYMFKKLPEVVAVNMGSPALRVGANGEPEGEPIPAGEVLWRGRCALASASTIPYYGFGLKMFPFADSMPGRFQLRMSDASTASILANLPGLFAGTWRSPRIQDFLCDRITIYLEKDGAFQVGGDLLGKRRSMTVQLASTPLDFVG